MINYILGLDIGIGSVGWAAINLDKQRIEDFGVRIFDSGESNNGKDRLSQERRRYRGMRRLVRRRSHRKTRLKNYLARIGLTTADKINEYYEINNNNVIELRYKGLSEKLSPEQLAACLIHICNYRGYKDFYEINIEEIEDAAEKKEYDAISRINDLMASGGYRTPAEMIYNCSEFDEPNSVYRKFHNSDMSEQVNLISRNMLEKEVELILGHQKTYYEYLNDDVITNIKTIIFTQRDFETGPGNENDQYRKFTGYLDTLGKCRYYKEEDRGSRFTLLADVYALVNTLSQYQYIDKEEKYALTGEMAEELINTALINGSLTKRDVSAIAKKHNITVSDKTSDTPITKCFKYIKTIKSVFEQNGYDWSELISDYTDVENNLLNRIGIILSQSQTPRRRINKLKELPEKLDNSLIGKLAKQKFSGTTNVSYRYMKACIEAFLEGDVYGKFQENIKTDIPEIDENSKPDKLPPFKNEDDCEFFKNPVVFRSINETRKLINAIISKYGYPNAVNVETADELNRTFEDRVKDTKRNAVNEKENDRIADEIIKLIGCDDKTARGLIEKYKLWEAQEGKCLYSGTPIDKESMLRDRSHLYEVDHIIPFSLILDNTINNKALVLASENQIKRQRTPLMYMNTEQASGFRKRVNVMMRSGKCSKKKYKYLLLDNLNDSSQLEEWKSRNLNDTRYICKYLVNYLRNNLRFNPADEFPDIINIKKNSRVYAVKSKFTSKFRRQWLNEATWGKNDKGELKKVTLLDHAADAIVIANCRPEYIIIAGEKIKLSQMYFDAGKKITPEYEASKNACIESLFKYHQIDRRTSERLLSGHTSRLTPIIPDLRDEVDKRLWDQNIFDLFWRSEGDDDSKYEELFRVNMRSLYKDDPEFADSVVMPLISYKPDRKYRGKITDENAISIKEINGKWIQLTRTSIEKITPKNVDSIYTGDKALLETLHDILDGKQKDYTLGKYLKDNNLSCFVTKSGKRVNKVTTISEAPARWLTKTISDNNKTLMTDRHYYCLELYKDENSNNNLQGIALSDIVHKHGKLWLKPDFRYPEDYKTHVMYIFPGDYIRVLKSNGSLKFEGYYKSTKDINTNRLYFSIDNISMSTICTITQKDNCIKLDIDLLGRVHGENGGKGISCGEPLSLLREKS